MGKTSLPEDVLSIVRQFSSCKTVIKALENKKLLQEMKKSDFDRAAENIRVGNWSNLREVQNFDDVKEDEAFKLVAPEMFEVIKDDEIRKAANYFYTKCVYKDLRRKMRVWRYFGLKKAWYKSMIVTRNEVRNEVLKSAVNSYTSFKKMESKKVYYKYFKYFINVKIIETRAFKIKERNVYKGRKDIFYIKIPDSVEIIQRSVFKDCKNLINVEFGKNVKYIGKFAFDNCNLRSLKIPRKVTNITERAFSNNNIRTLTILKTVERIDTSAFLKSEIESLTIEEGLQEIGRKSFESNRLRELRIPNSVKVIGIGAFHLNRNLTTVTLGNSVKTIKASAFQHCFSLNAINFPEGVEYIGKSAFSDSGLESVEIPSQVISVDNRAFAWNGKLKKIDLPNVKQIKDMTFYKCVNLTEVNLSDKLEIIGTRAFEKCMKLTKLILPDKLETIGSTAFQECGLYKVVIGKNVKEIENSAFYRNNLRIVKIKDGGSLEKIGAFAFARNPIGTLKLGDSVRTIEKSAFEGHELTKLTLPQSLKRIGFHAFYSNHIIGFFMNQFEFIVKLPNTDIEGLDDAFQENTKFVTRKRKRSFTELEPRKRSFTKLEPLSVVLHKLKF